MGVFDLPGRIQSVVDSISDSQLEARLTDVDITDKPDNGEELDRGGNVDSSPEGRNYYIQIKDWGQEVALGAKDIDQDGTLDVVYDRFTNKTYAPWDRYFQKAQEVARDFEKSLPVYMNYAQRLSRGEMPDTTVRTNQSGNKTVESYAHAYRDVRLDSGMGTVLRMEDNDGDGYADEATFKTPDGQTRIEILFPKWYRIDEQAPLKSAWLYLFSLGSM